MSLNFRRYIHTLILSIILLSLPHLASAQDSEIEELLSLDLEDLIVSVASKRDEKIAEAPGVINVLTAKEIELSGARTVFQALERLPGVFNIISSTTPERTLSIRGNGSDLGDTHVLILLNGRPIREGYSGALNSQFWRNMPLNAVERIEVIRGPGSALYGSNAFAGVVNVVTKKVEEGIQTETSFLYGSDNTKQGEFSVGQKNEHGGFFAAIKADGTNGRPANGNNIFGQPIDDRFEQNNLGATLQLQHDGLSFNFLQTSSTERVNNIPALATSFQQVESSQTFIDIGYTHDFSDDWTGSVNASLTRTSIDLAPTADFQTNDLYFESNINGDPVSYTHLTLPTIYSV